MYGDYFMRNIIAAMAALLLATGAVAAEADQTTAMSDDQAAAVSDDQAAAASYDEQAAAADNDGSSWASGFYVQANAGVGFLDNQGNDAFKKSNFAGSAAVGYIFNPYVATEVVYMMLPGYKGNDGAKLKNQVLGLNVVGMYPLAKGFSIDGKLGLDYMMNKLTKPEVSDKTNGTVLGYGVGIDYAFANIAGLHLGVDYYRTDKNQLFKKHGDKLPAQNLVAFGVRYQF